MTTHLLPRWAVCLAAAAVMGVQVACSADGADRTESMLGGNEPWPTPASCPAPSTAPANAGVQDLLALAESAHVLAREAHPDAVLRNVVLPYISPSGTPIPGRAAEPAIPPSFYFAGGFAGTPELVIVQAGPDGVIRATRQPLPPGLPRDLDLSTLKLAPETVVAIINRALPDYSLVSTAIFDQGCGATWSARTTRQIDNGRQMELLDIRIQPDGTIEEVSRSRVGPP